MPKKWPRDAVTITVRPTSRPGYLLAAFIHGTTTEGVGNTVWEAIEDLFTAGPTGEVCAELDRAVAAAKK